MERQQPSEESRELIRDLIQKAEAEARRQLDEDVSGGLNTNPDFKVSTAHDLEQAIADKDKAADTQDRANSEEAGDDSQGETAMAENNFGN